MDGFAAEYLSRNLTPTLEALRECGVRVPFMRSTFPTTTFANHYSMITVSQPLNTCNGLWFCEFYYLFILCNTQIIRFVRLYRIA